LIQLNALKIKFSSFIRINILILLLILIYCFIVNFQINDYVVPDYELYYEYGKSDLKVIDGFSPHFLFLSKYLFIYFDYYKYFIPTLFIASLLFYSILLRILIKNRILTFLNLIFQFSLGYYYYFNGKFFYEFPFIIFFFNLSILGIFLSCKYKLSFLQYLFFIVLGYSASWKTHAVFPILGFIFLYLLFLKNNKYNFNLYYISKLFICIIIGYLIGLYYFFIHPLDALNGLRGYKAESDLFFSLLSNNRYLWDHVNNYSFNNGILNIISFSILCFYLPLFVIDRYKIIIFNLLYVSIFFYLSANYTYGFIWQFFPFAMYFPLLLLYISVQPGIYNKKFSYSLFFLVGFQFINNFLFYIPLEFKDNILSKKAIFNSVRYSTQAYDMASEIIKENGKKYKLEFTLKRSKILQGFVSPLVEGDGRWSVLLENQCQSPCKPDYVIIIEPIDLLGVSIYKTSQMDNFSLAGKLRVGFLKTNMNKK